MARKATAVVPDAWEDDWEAQADMEEDGGVRLEPQEEEVKLTKAERLAKHAEENKKMWQSAYVSPFPTIIPNPNNQPRSETPEPFHFLAAKDTVPLKAEFKPTLKVLSRKPASQGADDGDDEEQLKKNKLSAEEMRAKTQREREEKQRKYEEVRARLFGTDAKSGSASPGNVTPPAGPGEEGRGGNRGKGRNRGGGGGGGGGGNGNGRGQDIRRPDSSHGGPRELFDPNYTAKPGTVSIARRSNEPTSGRSTPNSVRGEREDGQVLRAPKGPDTSGRGGFAFANRGGRAG